MIIVSQDKDNIINFDNVKSLWIDSNVLDKTNVNFEICADDEILGQYKTKERAKKVLNEIIEIFTLKQFNGKKLSKEQYDMIIKAMQFNIYEMPED